MLITLKSKFNLSQFSHQTSRKGKKIKNLTIIGVLELQVLELRKRVISQNALESELWLWVGMQIAFTCKAFLLSSSTILPREKDWNCCKRSYGHCDSDLVFVFHFASGFPLPLAGMWMDATSAGSKRRRTGGGGDGRFMWRLGSKWIRPKPQCSNSTYTCSKSNPAQCRIHFKRPGLCPDPKGYLSSLTTVYNFL